MTEIEEKRISYSEYKNWKECSYRHKLIYIDKLPYYSSNEYTAFGTAIHTAAEYAVSNDESSSIYEIFQQAFLEELKNLKDNDHPLNTVMIQDMRAQAKQICNQLLPELLDYFKDFEVFSVEEPLMEPISRFDSHGRKFKGFIDLVIKTSDGKYHIIDWKSCSWGWHAKKKSDTTMNYQLTMYKHFFSEKHNIDPSKINTYFGLLKRTAKVDNVEIFRTTSGEKKINNCLSSLEKSVINIEKGFSIKNRLSCKYCKFYNTENCT